MNMSTNEGYMLLCCYWLQQWCSLLQLQSIMQINWVHNNACEYQTFWHDELILEGYNRFLLRLCINLTINFPIYNSHESIYVQICLQKYCCWHKRCQFTSYYSRMSMIYNYMKYQHEWLILVQTPGLAERYTTWHYTIPPDLTSRSGFTTDQRVVFSLCYIPVTLELTHLDIYCVF